MIAIHNVRLFNETREALERQTATADILQVISASVSDPKPVFEKILASCERLFGGNNLIVFLVGEDGLLHLAAMRGPDADRIERTRKIFPVPLEGTATEQAIRERRMVTYANVLHDPDVPDGLRRIAAQYGENYSLAIAPMIWEGRAIGSILVGREMLQNLAPKEQTLLKTFADQAVIAIQNARLFRETQGSARAPDRHRRDPEGHRQFAVGRAAGVRGHRDEFQPPHRRLLDGGVPHLRRQAAPGGVHADEPGRRRGAASARSRCRSATSRSSRRCATARSCASPTPRTRPRRRQ